MSIKEINIYWLDDESYRFRDFKSLLEESAADYSLVVKIYPILVEPTLISTIEQWERLPPAPAPDLFMLDHVLLAQLPHRMTGNTLAHILRRTFVNIPLVSVTAMFTPGHDHSGQDIHEYTAIIEYNNLSENIENLFSIAKDYGLLNIGSWAELMETLCVPESEKRILQLAIPQEFVRDTTPTKHNQLARWIRSELLAKPGYLFDELHAATFLGLSVAGFRKVRNRFDAALYLGPFATNKRPLWWQTKLRERLYEIVGEESSDYTQAAGRMLSDFEENDLCKCYVSNASNAVDFVVAQTYPNQLWHAVREQYAIPNPDSFSPLPGFNQLLIIN